MNRAANFGGLAGLLLGMFLSVPAQASIINIYTGTSPGAGPANPHLFADVGANSFKAALGSNLDGLVNFENLSAGAGVPLSFAGGTITAVNASNPPFVADVETGGSATTGYNTTVGGSQYFRVDTTNGTQATIITFNFDRPVFAFGLYLTGLGDGPGFMRILFNDGVPESIPVFGNANGGAMFVGFVADHHTNSVQLRLDPVGGFVNDSIGVDDVMFATNPEPGTFVMLGTAALGFGLWRRRRLKK